MCGPKHFTAEDIVLEEVGEDLQTGGELTVDGVGDGEVKMSGVLGFHHEGLGFADC